LVFSKEIHKGEKRVAIAPEAVKKIITMGFEVSVESGKKRISVGKLRIRVRVKTVF